MKILRSTQSHSLKTKAIQKTKQYKSSKSKVTSYFLKNNEDQKTQSSSTIIQIESQLSIEQNIQQITFNDFNTHQQIIFMVNELILLNFKMKYSLDTLIICVKMLKKLLLKGKIENYDNVLFIHCLFVICSKTFQARQVTITDMVNYSGIKYGKSDCIIMQEKILKRLNYEIFIETQGTNQMKQFENELVNLGIQKNNKIMLFQEIIMNQC